LFYDRWNMQLLLVGVPYNTVLVIDTVLVQIFIQRVLCGCCARVTALKDEEDKKDLGGHTLTTRECMEYVSLSVGVRMSLA
jgi:hypothetical protein